MMVMLALAAASASPQCGSVPISQMVDSYAALIRAQDSAAIAHLFRDDGIIDNPGAAPIRGESAIRAFLSGFKGAVVNSETMAVANVQAGAGDWRVTGRFHQTGVTPEGKNYDVTGSFDSAWACDSSGWRLKRMATGK